MFAQKTDSDSESENSSFHSANSAESDEGSDSSDDQFYNVEELDSDDEFVMVYNTSDAEVRTSSSSFYYIISIAFWYNIFCSMISKVPGVKLLASHENMFSLKRDQDLEELRKKVTENKKELFPIYRVISLVTNFIDSGIDSHSLKVRKVLDSLNRKFNGIFIRGEDVVRIYFGNDATIEKMQENIKTLRSHMENINDNSDISFFEGYDLKELILFFKTVISDKNSLEIRKEYSKHKVFINKIFNEKEMQEMQEAEKKVLYFCNNEPEVRDLIMEGKVFSDYLKDFVLNINIETNGVVLKRDLIKESFSSIFEAIFSTGGNKNLNTEDYKVSQDKVFTLIVRKVTKLFEIMVSKVCSSKSVKLCKIDDYSIKDDVWSNIKNSLINRKMQKNILDIKKRLKESVNNEIPEEIFIEYNLKDLMLTFLEPYTEGDSFKVKDEFLCYKVNNKSITSYLDQVSKSIIHRDGFKNICLQKDTYRLITSDIPINIKPDIMCFIMSLASAKFAKVVPIVVQSFEEYVVKEADNQDLGESKKSELIESAYSDFITFIYFYGNSRFNDFPSDSFISNFKQYVPFIEIVKENNEIKEGLCDLVTRYLYAYFLTIYSVSVFDFAYDKNCFKNECEIESKARDKFDEIGKKVIEDLKPIENFVKNSFDYMCERLMMNDGLDFDILLSLVKDFMEIRKDCQEPTVKLFNYRISILEKLSSEKHVFLSPVDVGISNKDEVQLNEFILLYVFLKTSYCSKFLEIFDKDSKAMQSLLSLLFRVMSIKNKNMFFSKDAYEFELEDVKHDERMKQLSDFLISLIRLEKEKGVVTEVLKAYLIFNGKEDVFIASENSIDNYMGRCFSINLDRYKKEKSKEGKKIILAKTCYSIVAKLCRDHTSLLKDLDVVLHSRLWTSFFIDRFYYFSSFNLDSKSHDSDKNFFVDFKQLKIEKLLTSVFSSFFLNVKSDDFFKLADSVINDDLSDQNKSSENIASFIINSLVCKDKDIDVGKASDLSGFIKSLNPIYKGCNSAIDSFGINASFGVDGFRSSSFFRDNIGYFSSIKKSTSKVLLKTNIVFYVLLYVPLFCLLSFIKVINFLLKMCRSCSLKSFGINNCVSFFSSFSFKRIGIVFKDRIKRPNLSFESGKIREFVVNIVFNNLKNNLKENFSDIDFDFYFGQISKESSGRYKVSKTIEDDCKHILSFVLDYGVAYNRLNAKDSFEGSFLARFLSLPLSPASFIFVINDCIDSITVDYEYADRNKVKKCFESYDRVLNFASSTNSSSGKISTKEIIDKMLNVNEKGINVSPRVLKFLSRLCNHPRRSKWYASWLQMYLSIFCLSMYLFVPAYERDFGKNCKRIISSFMYILTRSVIVLPGIFVAWLDISLYGAKCLRSSLFCNRGKIFNFARNVVTDASSLFRANKISFIFVVLTSYYSLLFGVGLFASLVACGGVRKLKRRLKYLFNKVQTAVRSVCVSCFSCTKRILGTQGEDCVESNSLSSFSKKGFSSLAKGLGSSVASVVLRK